jgi:hypothetical protein
MEKALEIRAFSREGLFCHRGALLFGFVPVAQSNNLPNNLRVNVRQE